MKIISLVNQKGGCGKTTTAVNLAFALSQKKYRCLLIDFDPQAHATFFLGVKAQFTTADVLESDISGIKVHLPDFAVNRSDNLWVLASSIGLSSIEQTLFNKPDKLKILSGVLADYDNHFDYCIIDCPPNLGILTLNALVVSDYAIAPMGICGLSLRGVDNLNQIFKMLYEHTNKLPEIFYLITQFDKRYRFSQVFLTKAKDQLGNRLLSSMIRTNIHLRESAVSGQSIFEYKKDARGSEDYKLLSEEIDELTKKTSTIKVSFNDTSSSEVYITGEFNGWQKQEIYKMSKTRDNTFAIDIDLKKGKYRYKFIADNRWIHDPKNQLIESDSFGGKNSILLVE